MDNENDLLGYELRAQKGFRSALIWTAGGSTRRFLSALPPALNNSICGIVDQNKSFAGRKIGSLTSPLQSRPISLRQMPS